MADIKISATSTYYDLGIEYLCMCRWARLTQSIALLDRYSNSLIYLIHQLTGQRSRARIHHSKGAEVVLVDNGMFAKEKNDRGYNV